MNELRGTVLRSLVIGMVAGALFYSVAAKWGVPGVGTPQDLAGHSRTYQDIGGHSGQAGHSGHRILRKTPAEVWAMYQREFNAERARRHPTLNVHRQAALDAAAMIVGTSLEVNENPFDMEHNGKAEIDPYECSGFVVNAVTGPGEEKKTVVMTAKHCVAPDPNDPDDLWDQAYKVTFFDGDEGRVDRWVADPYNDVAWLVVSSRHHHRPVIFAKDEPQRGDNLFIICDCLSNSWTYAEAIAGQGSLYSHSKNWPYTYSMDCYACAEGGSGSAVTNEEGKVVGVYVAGDDPSVGDHQLYVPVRRFATLKDMRVHGGFI